MGQNTKGLAKGAKSLKFLPSNKLLHQGITIRDVQNYPKIPLS